MVYNPYTDLKKQQDKMNNSGLGAVIKPIQKGADAFAGAMENSPVAAPMRRIMADRENQQTMLATDERKKLREGLGRQFPEGREVFSNAKGQTSNMDPLRENQVMAEARGGLFPARNAQAFTPQGMTGVQRGVQGVLDKPMSMTNNARGFMPRPENDPIQPTMENSTAARGIQEAGGQNQFTGPTQTVYTNDGINNNQIIARRSLGTPMQDTMQPPAQVGNLSRIQRAGNLDIQFNPSVSQEARQAFMTNPARPTAQIDRYAANKAEEDANYERIRQDARAMNPALAKADQFNDQQKLARETLGINRMTAEGNLELGRGNLAVSQANVGNQSRLAQSQITGAGIDQEAKRMTIDEQRRVQGLQKTYDEAKTPEDRAKAERSLIAAGALKRDKPEVFFDEERDSMGTVTSKKPYILENGSVRPAIPGSEQRQTAPQEALDILAKNKNDQKTKKYFLDTFGYLPAGY